MGISKESKTQSPCPPKKRGSQDCNKMEYINNRMEYMEIDGIYKLGIALARCQRAAIQNKY